LSRDELDDVFCSRMYRCHTAFTRHSMPIILHQLRRERDDYTKGFGEIVRIETRIVDAPIFHIVSGVEFGQYWNADRPCRHSGAGLVTGGFENSEFTLNARNVTKSSRWKIRNDIYKTQSVPVRGKSPVFCKSIPTTGVLLVRNQKYRSCTAPEAIQLLWMPPFWLIRGDSGSWGPGGGSWDRLGWAGEDAYKLKIECNNIEVIKKRRHL